MEDLSQWSYAFIIGISIAGFLAWFNKSGSDFRDGLKFREKITKKKNQIKAKNKFK